MKNSTILILLIGFALVAYYIWNKNKEVEAAKEELATIKKSDAYKQTIKPKMIFEAVTKPLFKIG